MTELDESLIVQKYMAGITLALPHQILNIEDLVRYEDAVMHMAMLKDGCTK